MSDIEKKCHVCGRTVTVSPDADIEEEVMVMTTGTVNVIRVDDKVVHRCDTTD